MANDKDESGKFLQGHSVSEATRKLMREAKLGKIGEQASGWKGGRYISDATGYVMVNSRGHPHCHKNGYIPEHRLVMEAHLERYLTNKEMVHHINGLKHDNRVENLQLYSRSEHHEVHYVNAFEVLTKLFRQGKVGFKNGRYFVRKSN